MSHPALPQSLREFIVTHFTTVEEIEILLLLWRHPKRWWSSAQVAQSLDVAEPVASRRLEQISGRFLDVQVGGEVCYRFEPRHDGRARRVAELGLAYKEQRMEVVGLVLMGRSMRHFADAFRLRRGEED